MSPFAIQLHKCSIREIVWGGGGGCFYWHQILIRLSWEDETQ
jgi:hypothetical protein